MMLVRTYVAPSQIEGMGAYAAEPIRQGTMVWRFEPSFDRLLHRSMLDTSPDLLGDYLRNYAYPHPTDPDYFVVEIDNGRFVNHTEEPNTDFSSVFEGYATRDIAVGEEITADYAQFDINFVPGEFHVPRGAVALVASNGHMLEPPKPARRRIAARGAKSAR